MSEPTQALYQCRVCRGEPRPKSDWCINPRQGWIECRCGRMPDRLERCYRCGELLAIGSDGSYPCPPCQRVEDMMAYTSCGG